MRVLIEYYIDFEISLKISVLKAEYEIVVFPQIDQCGRVPHSKVDHKIALP